MSSSKDVRSVTAGASSGAGHVKSPMPGRVVKVLVKEGQQVCVCVCVCLYIALRITSAQGVERSPAVCNALVQSMCAYPRLHVCVCVCVSHRCLLVPPSCCLRP